MLRVSPPLFEKHDELDSVRSETVNTEDAVADDAEGVWEDDLVSRFRGGIDSR